MRREGQMPPGEAEDQKILDLWSTHHRHPGGYEWDDQQEWGHACLLGILMIDAQVISTFHELREQQYHCSAEASNKIDRVMSEKLGIPDEAFHAIFAGFDSAAGVFSGTTELSMVRSLRDATYHTAGWRAWFDWAVRIGTKAFRQRHEQRLEGTEE